MFRAIKKTLLNSCELLVHYYMWINKNRPFKWNFHEFRFQELVLK